MSKHTQGPWNVFPAVKGRRPGVDSPSGSIIVFGVKGEDDAGVYSGFIDNDEIALANARLIAAAPELLEALEIAYFRLEDILKGDDGQAWKEAAKSLFKIHKAIAKAKGEV